MGRKVKEVVRIKSVDDTTPEALRYQIATRSDAQRLVELYYWSQEEHLVEFMRAFIRLPEESKAALTSYLSLGIKNSGSIGVTIDEKGSLILSAPQVCHELQKQNKNDVPDESEWVTH